MQQSESRETLYVGLAHTRNLYKRKPYNFATYMLKSYLNALPFSFGAFMISKTHIASSPKTSWRTA